MHFHHTKKQSAIWTAFVRIVHWLVAVSVLINFFNETDFWHRTIGYFCLFLVLARIVDGLWLSQSPSSKFYMPTSANIKSHLIEIKTQHFVQHAGHNPLGQLAVYLIWLLIILLALTGWISRTDAYWGEDWPVDLHVIFSNTLQGLVVLHLLAVVVMSKLQKKNLVKQMLTGQPSDNRQSQ